MNEEVKGIVNDLLCCIENRCYNCKMLSGSATCWQIVGKQAADLLEKLAAENKQLCDALADSVALSRKLKARCEAAERDLRSVIQYADEGCKLCVHHHECQSRNCPNYIEGMGATDWDGKSHPDFKWTCRDFEFGTCAALENTPCNGCDFENHFSWRGPGKEEAE